ncbi:MAG TPA: hypothetical protein VNW99_08835 [Cytophagaceae bacterium]|jgi:hypothetical protein|nr:hypothetical protein [Cytophagaceae bacterium]
MKIVSNLCFNLLCIALCITSCTNKKEETLAAIDSLRKYGDTAPAVQFIAPLAKDSSLAIYYDTLFPPAGDDGSRTFFHLKNGLVYTGQAVNEKPALSKDIVMAYFYHNDPDTLATLTNMYTFPYPYNNWKKTMTLFRKGVSDEAYQLCNTNSDLANVFHHSSKADSIYGAAYKLAAHDIIVFKTEQNKYGLIRVKNLVPGNNPYKNFLTFEMKVQK